ncbi:3-methyl-2-oxobutanoate hydroxymethyltransferase [Devosia nitrariae]|uniref:3-methyl-2-oxobutanoate hydroxymethyltransferase n=1 Tax=Devosia nitrariae TaxID=2071872 RepID=A0ABQ5W9A8_9HYPH|nr:3-methyl-2-oxobutanoate hydroxymethyltransferase [Devosia nitrariae]GLQ56303.1 3-methyl-2-oxobutanoate hydroxymethyltransferase [Devosia nitrariae]
MGRTRPTVADIRALKGVRQLTMLRVETMEEAEAAEKAGVDMISVPPALVLRPDFRDAAPNCFAVPGLEYGDFVTAEDYLRGAFQVLKASADAVYCAASYKTVRRLREEGIPVCGHSGLIPSQRTWTGGFKAVGKTAETAMLVWQQVKALEEAGAFAAEIEVVPSPVAAAISQRTSLVMISMGAGAGCDAQYLFATDVVGSNRGHVPRHAKVYRNFAAEYERLQAERIAAFTEYVADVRGGAYPEARHEVAIEAEELEAFLVEIG